MGKVKAPKCKDKEELRNWVRSQGGYENVDLAECKAEQKRISQEKKKVK